MGQEMKALPLIQKNSLLKQSDAAEKKYQCVVIAVNIYNYSSPLPSTTLPTCRQDVSNVQGSCSQYNNWCHICCLAFFFGQLLIVHIDIIHYSLFINIYSFSDNCWSSILMPFRPPCLHLWIFFPDDKKTRLDTNIIFVTKEALLIVWGQFGGNHFWTKGVKYQSAGVMK